MVDVLITQHPEHVEAMLAAAEEFLATRETHNDLGDGAMNVMPRAMWDWQNHVDRTVQRMWPKLSKETRVAVYLCAQMAKRRIPDAQLAAVEAPPKPAQPKPRARKSTKSSEPEVNYPIDPTSRM